MRQNEIEFINVAQLGGLYVCDVCYPYGFEPSFKFTKYLRKALQVNEHDIKTLRKCLGDNIKIESVKMEVM